MILNISTTRPEDLLSEIRRKIKDEEIDTWYDLDERGFTHTGQWKEEAYLMPLILSADGILRFSVKVDPDCTKDPSYLGCLYLGRFVEMLLWHARDHFSEISIKV